MAYQCMVGRTAEELSLGIEVMAECRRNPAIAKLFQDLEDDITERLVKMLETAAARRAKKRARRSRATAAM